MFNNYRDPSTLDVVYVVKENKLIEVYEMIKNIIITNGIFFLHL